MPKPTPLSMMALAAALGWQILCPALCPQLACPAFGQDADASADTDGADGDGFVDLFDGESLDAWVQRGGKAVYTIEGGAIVGTSVPGTPNSFLCTRRDYADFVLTVELKVDDGLNSGIQIRSECFDRAITARGVWPSGKPFKARVPAGRVHGYQVEIDPSARAFSGGIYDEGRRGWLYKPAGERHAAARGAFRRGEWNRYRIEAAGDRIRTWVNGVPVADLTDAATATGFIALQVHAIRSPKQVGTQVRWRNIRLKELAPQSAAGEAAADAARAP